MAGIEEQTQSSSKQREALELAIGRLRRPDWNVLLQKPAQWDVATVITSSLLDRVHDKMHGSLDDVEIAMTDLLSVLWSVKSATSPEAWERIGSQCLAHPLRYLIHEDPFALRCFSKPRGYAGDAVLIDYLYSRNCRLNESDQVSRLGQQIFDFTRDIPAGHAVRKRRDLMATLIDEVCAAADQPHILSVACGHLREATLSKAVVTGRTGRFIALDQDELSLQLVEREVTNYGITPVCNSIKALFRGPVSEEKFDLIYSTGLYDYLDDRLANRLTQRMFEMLNPGGRLVVANFVPDIGCSAYMEAFLDWKLIYRNADQMLELCAGVPADQIASRKTYIEENENIIFMDIVKR
jgi:extracellular factor (EF) 3-hydroxypalmitic acid methyl ester biosynthesis protein